MSNNTTINSELFQNLLVQSEFALYETSIARAVARVFDYPMNAGNVVQIPVWANVTATEPGEGVAPPPGDTGTSTKTIALSEMVTRNLVTDFLRDSANENVIASLASEAGFALSSKLDDKLIALFADALITQSVGAAGAENTVAQLMKAAAIIRANKYQGPLFAVLNPLQAYGVKAAMTATNSYQNASSVADSILANYFVGQIAGISILEHSGVGIDVDGDSVGCVFAPSAFGVAQRGGIAMETQRDAGARATDVVMTLVAGTGIVRPELAVKVVGAAGL